MGRGLVTFYPFLAFFNRRLHSGESRCSSPSSRRSEGGGIAQLERGGGGGLETCGHGPQVGAPCFFTFYTLVFDKIIARSLCTVRTRA
jgi:hypothetical protein